MTELHQKYAPILRFAKDERFFPMRADDILRYSSLYVKGQSEPILGPGHVTPDYLAEKGNSPELFLRSIEHGSLLGSDVIAGWSRSAIELVYRWAEQAAARWTDELAQRAYSWFSPKTRAATQLFWWNDLLTLLVQETRASGSAGDLPRLLLPRENREAAIGRYEFHCCQNPSYTYYYRQVYDGSYMCLQYWFFYAYNDWAGGFNGMNDHEGDWEGVSLFFRLDSHQQPQEPPAYITYAGHTSRLTKPWDHPDVQRIGNHPVGYVGAGSHATYPQARLYPLVTLYNLIDHANGQGPTIEPDQWVHRICLDDVPWLTAYRGSWGTRYWLALERARSLLSLAAVASPLALAAAATLEREVELPGVSAPHGPMLGDTGAQRPQWLHPVAWAEIPAVP